jgi:hypothetical protein
MFATLCCNDNRMIARLVFVIVYLAALGRTATCKTRGSLHCTAGNIVGLALYLIVKDCNQVKSKRSVCVLLVS